MPVVEIAIPVLAFVFAPKFILPVELVMVMKEAVEKVKGAVKVLPPTAIVAVAGG